MKLLQGVQLIIFDVLFDLVVAIFLFFFLLFFFVVFPFFLFFVVFFFIFVRVLSDPESVARFGDKFIVQPKFVVDYLQHLEVMEFKKKKRLEERARESREAREKSYEDYHWANLCEDATKLKKLRVPELNKYLKHHGLLKQHQKSNKNDKVKTIMGHFLRMNTLRTGQAEVGGRNESGQLNSSDESSEGEETDDDYKSDAPDSEDDSNDVVLAFIASDEEYADERPATTRSGRAVTRRAEIDFSFF